MNTNITALYVAITENRAVFFETNLKKFVTELNKLEPKSRNYDYYYRQFDKSDVVQFVNSKDKVYVLQKLL